MGIKNQDCLLYISKLTARKFPNIVIFLSYGIHHTKGLSFTWGFPLPVDPTDIKLQNWMLEAKFCYPVIIMCDFKALSHFFCSPYPCL